MTHICVGNLTIIGSHNGLSPGRRQAIIWTNAGVLLIEPLRTNFSEISIGIQTFLFKKMHLNMSSAKWRPFCLGLNVLNNGCIYLSLPLPHCKLFNKWGPGRLGLQCPVIVKLDYCTVSTITLPAISNLPPISVKQLWKWNKTLTKPWFYFGVARFFDVTNNRFHKVL